MRVQARLCPLAASCAFCPPAFKEQAQRNQSSLGNEGRGKVGGCQLTDHEHWQLFGKQGTASLPDTT